MDLVSLLILLVVVIAIGAVVYWFLNKVSLPRPWDIVVYAVIAILAIIVIVKVSGVRF